MVDLLSIQLQAINAEKNIFRQYELYVGKDLFGCWLLTTAYGRIGKVTKLRNYSFDSFEGLQKKLQQLLRKRLSSQKRVGTNYRSISYSFSENSSEDTYLKVLKSLLPSSLGE